MCKCREGCEKVHYFIPGHKLKKIHEMLNELRRNVLEVDQLDKFANESSPEGGDGSAGDVGRI